MPRQEPVQVAKPFTEFWAKGTGTSKIGNRCLTLFLPSSGCPAGALDELTTILGNVGDTVFQPAAKAWCHHALTGGGVKWRGRAVRAAVDRPFPRFLGTAMAGAAKRAEVFLVCLGPSTSVVGWPPSAVVGWPPSAPWPVTACTLPARRPNPRDVRGENENSGVGAPRRHLT
jgi:hypothetical protein